MPIIRELLRDDYSFEQAEVIQLKYQNLMSQLPENKYIKNLHNIKTISGVDISYYKKEKIEYGLACAVVWNLNQKKVMSYSFANEAIRFPYKPGFLGFRECKLLSKVILKLRKRPDFILCDSHGKIHPRRFGEAVHLGFALNISTIGVAKKPYIGYCNSQEVQLIKGNKSLIWAKDPGTLIENSPNELLGYAVCLNKGLKPVFISNGYNMTLDIALKICLESTIGHRQPEPLYLADKLSREEVSNHI
jgi:deoxyribonuclease V